VFDLGKVLVEAKEIMPSDEYYPKMIWISACKKLKECIGICYWIEWEGYPDKKDLTWKPMSHQRDSTRAQELLLQFHQENLEVLRYPDAGAA